MNLERAALAALAKREENDFLRALRDLLAPPDGESKPFVSDALNLIGDRLIVLGGTTRPEALRNAAIEECARACQGLVVTPGQPVAVLEIYLEVVGKCAARIRALKTTPSPLARRPIKCPPEDGGWET